MADIDNTPVASALAWDYRGLVTNLILQGRQLDQSDIFSYVWAGIGDGCRKLNLVAYCHRICINLLAKLQISNDRRI